MHFSPHTTSILAALFSSLLAFLSAQVAAQPAADAPTTGVMVMSIAPQPVQMHEPKRTIEATPASLKDKLTTARGGDEFVLAPGRYGWTNVEIANAGAGNSDWTEDDRIALRSADPKNPAIFDGMTVFRPYVTLVGVAVERNGIDVLGGHHFSALGCAIGDLNEPGRRKNLDAAIGFRRMDGRGGNKVIGCVFLETHFAGVKDGPTVPPGVTSYGVKFELGVPMGMDNEIRGCLLNGFKDAISLCETLTSPSGRIAITDNVIFNCSDDAIEADGGLVDSEIARNIIGRTLNGISIAPCGPGPVSVSNNIVANYRENGLKTNNNVGGATSGVTVEENIFLPAADQKGDWPTLMFAFEGEVRVALLRNIIVGKHRLLHQSKAPCEETGGGHCATLVLDGNQYFAQRILPNNAPFRVWNPGKRELNWSGSFMLMKTRSGQEEHGVYGDPKLEPTAIRYRHPLSGEWIYLPPEAVVFWQPTADHRGKLAEP
jgi:hypothetical protein